MKHFLKFAVLFCIFFLTNLESNATNWEFTWVNTTACNITVTVRDGTGATLYSSSTCCGPLTCLSNVATIEITDNIGGLTHIYNTCGDLVNTTGTGTFCTAATIIVSGCGPAGPTCGPGSKLLTVNI